MLIIFRLGDNDAVMMMVVSRSKQAEGEQEQASRAQEQAKEQASRTHDRTVSRSKQAAHMTEPPG